MTTTLFKLRKVTNFTMQILNIYKYILPIFLFNLFSVSTIVYASPNDPLASPKWEVMHKSLLSNESVVFDDRVKVIAPEMAENPLSVPISVIVTDIADIEEIRVFADISPIPEIMRFYPGEFHPYIGFRIKVDKKTPVRAAVRTKEGVWYVGGRWLDTGGSGCTTPSDGQAKGGLGNTLGSVKSRLWVNKDRSKNDRIRFKVMHPMETGLIKDFPAFYINTLELIDADDMVLARIEPNVPISEYPVFTLDFNMKQEQKVRLVGEDNNGNKINQVLFE
jgi:sulfur-oxidizing protein SoxY